MKKEINLFVLILLLGQFLYAQDNYKPGYVLTIKKDTINGFILNNIDAELADKISFKRNSSDEAITEYAPSELLGFGFSSGRIFERKRVRNDNQSSNESTYVFAKRIVKGKIDLFVWSHKKNNSKDFFVINNSTKREARLIKPKKTNVKTDGKTYSKSDNNYKHNIAFVKQEENLDPEQNDLSFGEKPIIKNIISFNKKFQNEYPIEIYKEPTHHNYDILVGIPLNMKSPGRVFTISAYRSKTFSEKSNILSLIYGLSYYDWRDNDKNKIADYQSQNAEINYIWQKLNIMPLGIKLQTNGKRIIPYGYFSVGGAVLMMTDYLIEDYEFTGSRKEYLLRPAINAGIGVKIRIKSNFLLSEITPAMNRVFFKIGYSF